MTLDATPSVHFQYHSISNTNMVSLQWTFSHHTTAV